MEQRVSLITLGVEDLERAAGFYEALGWSRQDVPGEAVIWFNLIGQSLGLYSKRALAEEIGLEADATGGFSGLTLAHNVCDKTQVPEILDAVKAAGGRVLKPAQDVFWGGYHGYFADLDGHVWEVAWNPFSPLGPDGEFQVGGAA